MINIKEVDGIEMVEIDTFLAYTRYSDRYTLWRMFNASTGKTLKIKPPNLSPKFGRTTQYWVSKSAVIQWATECNNYGLLTFMGEQSERDEMDYEALYLDSLLSTLMLEDKLDKLESRNWFQRLFNLSSTK